MNQDHPSWATGVNTNVPSPARVYDVFLGGSHNFEVDREMAKRLEVAMPDIGDIMRANRAFLRRAIGYLSEIGIRQFLDLGSGIPTVGNVHEVARRSAPDSRVVYVDVDPVAVAHARAVLGDDPLTVVVEADLREPDQVLGDPAAKALLDFDQPIGLLIAGVMHQIVTVDPIAMIAQYRAVMVPGSHLVLSQATGDQRPDEANSLKRTYNNGYAPDVQMTLRTRAETLALFEGYELVEPGLVQLPQWRPDELGDPTEDADRFTTYAGVGRLTDPS